ncbi:putative transcriptional regulator [Leifsonia rubra CMS 76R]|nr:putative transcriptional regulator [Leifsonia rubra CMS 76R]
MTTEMSRLEALAGNLIDEHDKLLSALITQRTSHQLTQQVVAERMGVSQPTVAAIEHYDANPTLATVRRYALAVGARIEHTVVDECCAIDEPFEKLVSSYSGTWPVLASQDAAPAPAWAAVRRETQIAAHLNG